jgi:hypothetical protein
MPGREQQFVVRTTAKGGETEHHLVVIGHQSHSGEKLEAICDAFIALQ